MLENDLAGFASGDSSLGGGLLENDFTLFDSSADSLLENVAGFDSGDSSLGNSLLENDFAGFASADSLLENVAGFASATGSLENVTGFASSLGEGNVSFTNSSSSSTGALTYSALFATCLGISSKLTRIIVVDSFGLDRIISLISSSEPSLFSNINLILNTTSSTSKLNIQFSESSLKESNHSSS